MYLFVCCGILLMQHGRLGARAPAPDIEFILRNEKFLESGYFLYLGSLNDQMTQILCSLWTFCRCRVFLQLLYVLLLSITFHHRWWAFNTSQSVFHQPFRLLHCWRSCTYIRLYCHTCSGYVSISGRVQSPVHPTGGRKQQIGRVGSGNAVFPPRNPIGHRWLEVNFFAR